MNINGSPTPPNSAVNKISKACEQKWHFLMAPVFLKVRKVIAFVVF